MTNIFNIYSGLADEQMQKLESLFSQLNESNSMNNAELTKALADTNDQVKKARDEIVANVAKLEAAIVAAGNSTPETDAALADLKGNVQSLDDLNPDTTNVPPTPI